VTEPRNEDAGQQPPPARHGWSKVLLVVTGLLGLAGLSYLGLGASPGSSDWGRMISDNRNLLFENPLAPLGPAMALVLTAVAVNLLGDWAYERVADRGRAR